MFCQFNYSLNYCLKSIVKCDDLYCFRGSLVFYTKRLLQTPHGKMAESRMADKEGDA